MKEGYLSISKKVNIAFEASYIYYLLDGERVVYVGISRNVIQRLGNHLSTGKKFDSARYHILPDDCDPLIEEFFEIARYEPKYNSSMISAKVGYMPLHRYRCESMGSPNIRTLRKAINRHFKGNAPSIHGVCFYTPEEVSNCLNKLHAETSV